MLRICNPLHSADICYFCPEENMAICNQESYEYKRRGNTLNPITDMAKMLLIDLKVATTQAEKLNQKIKNICNFAPNSMPLNEIINAFEQYLFAFISARDKTIASIKGQTGLINPFDKKELAESLENLEKTISDSDEYGQMISTYLSQNHLFQAINKMQEISVKQWNDEMQKIQNKVSEIELKQGVNQQYQLIPPERSYESILRHVGIAPNKLFTSLPFSSNSPQGIMRESNNMPKIPPSNRLIEPRVNPNPPSNLSLSNLNENNNHGIPKIIVDSPDRIYRNPVSPNAKGIALPGTPSKKLIPLEIIPVVQPPQKVKNPPIQDTDMDPTKLFRSKNPPPITASSLIINPQNTSQVISQSLSFVPIFKINEITLINVLNRTLSKIPNPFSVNFPDSDFSAVYCREGMFINGGKRNNKILQDTFFFNLKTKSLEKYNTNMLEARKCHTNVNVDNNCIYSITGANDDKSPTSSTEKYFFQRNTYEYSEAVLNSSRSYAIAFCLDKKFIYCLGGNSVLFASFNVNEIEKLDLTNEAKGWQIIQINNNSDLSSRAGANCFELSSGTFVIFGGTNQITLNNCFTINRNDQISLYSSKLSSPEDFIPHVQPLIDSNKVYVLSSQLRLCCFDLASQAWSTINYNTWPNY